jgi:hypothetical protein
MIVFFRFFLGSQCKDVFPYLRNSKEGVNQERKKERKKKGKKSLDLEDRCCT